MKIRIVHETIYTFSSPVTRTVQYLRLTPRRDRCQHVLSWSVSGPDTLVDWVDGLGNRVTAASEYLPGDRLHIHVEGVVETTDTGGVLPLDDGLPPLMFLRTSALTAPADTLRALAKPFRAVADREGPIPALHGLMDAIADRVPYTAGTTHAASTAAEALDHGVGVCQDHAHIFIACARLLGFPARYVSGYLAAGDGTMASHAWGEAHVPLLGWVSFDPSNRQCATDAYVRLAIGHDYAGARPVSGVRQGGGEEEMDVRLAVEQAQE
jgi:transglutaminase-like putative cysteine protease